MHRISRTPLLLPPPLLFFFKKKPYIQSPLTCAATTAGDLIGTPNDPALLQRPWPRVKQTFPPLQCLAVRLQGRSLPKNMTESIAVSMPSPAMPPSLQNPIYRARAGVHARHREPGTRLSTQFSGSSAKNYTRSERERGDDLDGLTMEQTKSRRSISTGLDWQKTYLVEKATELRGLHPL